MGRKRGRPRIKRAVIVGIDRYQPEEINLNGCTADALDFYRNITRWYGFAPRYCTLLLNEDATKSNIMQALSEMVSKTQAKQEAVYYQSGHGSQIEDGSGDEADHLDEVVIPYDFNFSNVISDDELYLCFSDLAEGGFLSMIMDTCFSGGTAKGMGTKTIQTMKTDPLLPLVHYGVKDSNPSTQRHVLLSGCREGEYSEEFYSDKYGYRGVLTFFLGKILYNYRKRNLTWQQTLSIISNGISSHSFSQHPTLSGRQDLLVRGVVGGRR